MGGLGGLTPQVPRNFLVQVMARTDHLPIYKASYDLCLYFEQVVGNFSRYHKYSLGADLRDGARRVLKLVVRANARRDKAPILQEIREEVEELKAVLRLCEDVKAFPNFNSFEHSFRLVTEIAKQNEGWLKSQPSIRARRDGVLFGPARGPSNATTTRVAE